MVLHLLNHMESLGLVVWKIFCLNNKHHWDGMILLYRSHKIVPEIINMINVHIKKIIQGKVLLKNNYSNITIRFNFFNNASVPFFSISTSDI